MRVHHPRLSATPVTGDGFVAGVRHVCRGKGAGPSTVGDMNLNRYLAAGRVIEAAGAVEKMRLEVQLAAGRN